MMKFTVTTPMLSLLLVLFLRSPSEELGVAALDTTAFDTYFCLRSPQVTTCPKPPTFDLVKLSALQGKWYEIGSNARFKLNSENGLACNFANYTVTSSAPNFWGVTQSNLSILDSGVKAIGPLAQYGTKQISSASKGICQNAREICKLLTSNSQLGQALSQLGATASKLLLLHPVEANHLMTASTNIGEAITGINVALDSLSRNVTRIQFLDAQLSQGNGSVKAIIQQVNNVTAQAALTHSAIQQSLKVITDARALVLQVTTKLLFLNSIDLPIMVVPDLGKVLVSLVGAEQDIINQISAVQLALFGVNSMTAMISLDSMKPSGMSTSTGNAVQNITFPGRLTASIHGGQLQAPFLILAVDGWANLGYNAALVYSCTEIPNNPYKQGLFIISRNRTLDQLVVNRFLDIARFNGIYTECDDPFLYTLQESPICLAPKTQTINATP